MHPLERGNLVSSCLAQTIRLSVLHNNNNILYYTRGNDVAINTVAILLQLASSVNARIVEWET